MDGEQRHLDRERGEERQEQPPLQCHAEVHALDLCQVEREVVELARGVERQHQDPGEHQQAAEQRVDEELHGGIDATLVAPVPDEEVHRDEHPFPEHIEEEQVPGEEDADHGGLEREQQAHEELGALVDLPGREDADRDQERCQEHQEQTDAIDTKLVSRTECRDPAMLLDHLHPGLAGVEAGEHAEREREGDDRCEQRPPADQGRPAVREDGEDNGAGERRPENPAEPRHQRTALATKKAISSTPPPRIPSAYERTNPVWSRRPAAATLVVTVPSSLTAPSMTFASTTKASAVAASMPTLVKRNWYTSSTKNLLRSARHASPGFCRRRSQSHAPVAYKPNATAAPPRPAAVAMPESAPADKPPSR